MSTKSDVTFKGTKNGIAVILNQEIPFPKLMEQFEKKVVDAAKFFKGATTPIIFRGRSLSADEEKALLDIIEKQAKMKVAYVTVENDNDEDIKKISVLLEKELQPQNITKFHKGSVRSGQILEYEGTLVILGDVNPGGIVRASGNIIILGQLKGIAHAGCNGLREAFVSATYMAPVQLRIADIITRFPEAPVKSHKKAEYAFVEDDQIYVSPLL